MEQLNNIKIEGYRSLKSLDLHLGPVTVLIGANGAGKSNFVDFFTMLNYALSGSLQLYVGRKGGAQALLHYGSKRTPVLNAELQFQGLQATSHYRFTLAHSAGDRFIYAMKKSSSSGKGILSLSELSWARGTVNRSCCLCLEQLEQPRNKEWRAYL